MTKLDKIETMLPRVVGIYEVRGSAFRWFTSGRGIERRGFSQSLQSHGQWQLKKMQQNLLDDILVLTRMASWIGPMRISLCTENWWACHSMQLSATRF